MADAAKVMERYHELEKLAYESIGNRSFYPTEIQERIRSFALIRDLEEAKEKNER